MLIQKYRHTCGDEKWVKESDPKPGKGWAPVKGQAKYITKKAEIMENKYLEKIALRRVISEIAKGLSTPLETLVSKGFVKGESAYNKGMKLGNRNIAKKLGVTISKGNSKGENVISNSGGGYITMNRGGDTRIIANPKPLYLSRQSPVHQGFVRHELFEAGVAKNPNSKTLSGNRSILSNAYSHIPEEVKNSIGEHEIAKEKYHVLRGMTDAPIHGDPVVIKNKAGGIVGQHLSPQVLTQESEMVRKNPYLSRLKSMRSITGEDNLVQQATGKKYGVDKMTGKDHAKANNYITGEHFDENSGKSFRVAQEK